MPPTEVTTVWPLWPVTIAQMRARAAQADLQTELAALAFAIMVSLGLFLLAAFWASRGEQPYSKEAERRAEALLAEFLSEAERRQLQQEHCLTVRSPSHPGRTYVVPAALATVAVYENGRQVEELCIQPTVPLPAADVVLAHKLMIECCEEQYLATSNRLSRRRPFWRW